MKRLLETIKNRPGIFFFIAAVTAVFCGAEQFNSFARKFGSFTQFFSNDYVQFCQDVLEWAKNKATNPKLMAAAIIILILMILAICAILAVAYSAFSYVMYVQAFSNIHPSDKKTKNTSTLIKEGINKRFGGMFVYFIIFAFSSIFMVLFTMYSLQPLAISLERVIGGDADALLGLIIIAILTVVIGAMIIVLYSMIMSFMQPSIIAFKKGAIRVSIKLVRSYIWYLIPRTFAFLIYNLGVFVLLLAMSYGKATGVMAAFVFFVNWLLRTLGMVVYTVYVYHTFIEMKDDLLSES